VAIVVTEVGIQANAAAVQMEYSAHQAHAVWELLQPRTVQIAADGRSRAVLQIQVPANALIDRYDLAITATRAELVVATQAADVRPDDSAAKPAIVVDFGTLRTVNAVLLPTLHAEHKVTAWLGTKFDTDNVIDLPAITSEAVKRGGEDGAPEYDLYIYPIPETRTERLLIELGESNALVEEVIPVLELSLPELPANLSLRINGGAPVWEHPGKVQLGTSAELNDSGWTAQGQRRVAIADALAEFTGDATNPQLVPLTLELSSGVPGLLQIEVAAQEMRLLHRLSFNNQAQLTLDFAAEGEQLLSLVAPPDENGDARAVKGVRLTLAGELQEQRVLPPLGPNANDITQLMLGQGRAACVRLDGGNGLVELTAVRMPLALQSSSAEAQVMLWQSADEDTSNAVPVTVLAEAVSEPVQWSDSDEQWISFTFAESVAFNATKPPWAALMVNRGEVLWAMSESTEGQYPLRLGAPEGPWRAPPAVFAEASALGAATGRVRVVGLAAQDRPLAPLLISLQGGPTDLAATPSEKGVRLQLDASEGEPLAAQAGEQAIALAGEEGTGAAPENNVTQLRIVSRTPGEVTLSEVDIITGI